jgi:hypothetical protein
MTFSEPPSSPKEEAAAAIIKGAVSAIPVVGGLISEVGNLYLNPLERRKQGWMREVAAAIQEIQERFAVLPEQLQTDERFISFLYQATIIALKNHQDEKIGALRGAVVSAVGPQFPSEDVAFQFLRYVDELTPTHLHILSCLAEHIGQFVGAESIEQVFGLFGRFRSMPVERGVFRLFLHDLDARFLIRIGDLDDLPEFASKVSYITDDSSKKPLEVTSLGRTFLSFIHDERT